VLLGGGGARKTMRDDETSASNSSDEASLLHEASGFISPSYSGGTTSSFSASSRQGLGGAIAVQRWRLLGKRQLLGSCGPKCSQGGVYIGEWFDVWIGDFFNRFGLDSLRDKTNSVCGSNSTARGGVRLGFDCFLVFSAQGGSGMKWPRGQGGTMDGEHRW
jgi:hypothetical protein